jgi:hypothetical protein
MALAKDIMQGGFSAGSARAVNGNILTGISAAGTTISDATDLLASINVIGTATAGSGVQLPSMMLGDLVEVYNGGSGAMFVYPDQTTVAINQLSAGAGFLLAPNTGVMVRKLTSTSAVAYLSA